MMQSEHILIEKADKIFQPLLSSNFLSLNTWLIIFEINTAL